MKIYSETMKKGNKSVVVKPNIKEGTTFEFFTGKEFDLSKTFHTLHGATKEYAKLVVQGYK